MHQDKTEQLFSKGVEVYLKPEAFKVYITLCDRMDNDLALEVLETILPEEEMYNLE